MISYIIQGFTIGLSAGSSPGPFQFYLLSQALNTGWRRTLPSAFAPLISDGPIVITILLLLAQLPDLFLTVLQIGGGLFVLTLAWGAYHAFRVSSPDELPVTPEGGSARIGLMKATLMNFLSPGPYLFWGTVLGPLTVKAWAESPGLAAGFVISFYTALLGFNVLFVLVFAKASAFGSKMVYGLKGFAALALLVFGLYQLWVGISHLLPARV